MVHYKNPVLPGFHPDPSVTRVGDTFYLVNSTFSYFPGVPIYESRDLVNWTQIGNVLSRRENLPLGTCAHSNGIYAPTIRYHEGTYYMITTNIENGGNFIVTAERPEGPWSDPHWLSEADGIDPSLFFDDDGKCYYCGTKGDPNGTYYGDNVIYIRELDVKTFAFVGEEFVAWKGALRDAAWPEGPHIYKRNGYYYVVNAEGGTGPDHAVVVARSRDIRGPYEGYKSNPVMTHRHMGWSSPVVAVGHADLVDDAEGNWYAVMLAMRPTEGCSNLGRETFVARVEWQNDWPVFNPGEGRLLESGTLPLPESKSYTDGTSYHFYENRLPHEMLMLRNPEPDMYSLTEKYGWLRLSVRKPSLREQSNPSYIGVRQTSMEFTAETMLRFVPEEGEEAGLALVQSNEANLRLTYTKTGDGNELRVVRCEKGQETLVVSLPAKSERIKLRLCQRGQQVRFFAALDDQPEQELSAVVDARYLSTERAGGFVGCTVGMYASGNGWDRGNKAYFAWFEYQNL